MAFDKNAVPKDFLTSSRRPIDGFYPNPLRNVVGNPNTTPALYCPSTMPDSSFMPLGFNNGAPKVCTGNYSPILGTRAGGNASDFSSDECSDDSVSGEMVKFLCSFGGKILPRPSDGALRYVGGQTRIISVRKNLTFGELVKKMTDIYAQHVVIKYQLPDEDLDALVVVSCTDDLENMMDEYEKFIERCLDGSPKLRIFLFSYSDLESSDLVHIGDLQVGEQKYVEAVNGIMEGNIGCIGSDAASSSQTSDFNGTEGVDFVGHSHGEVISIPCSYGLSAIEHSRMMCLDPNPVVYTTDACSAPLSIPSMVRCGLPEQEVGRYVPLSVPQSLPGVSFPVSSPYVPAAYIDPRQETLSRANYVQHNTSQMGFPASSFASTRPIAVPTVVPMQQARLEHYPAERRVVERVLQLPNGQGYNASHAQVPIKQGGLYDRFQLPNSEQMALSEGSGSVLPDRGLHLDNRGLPMTRPIVAGTLGEGKIAQLPRPQAHESVKIHTNGIGVSQYVHIPPQRENLEHSKVTLPQNVMMSSGAQSPYDVFSPNTPQPCHVDAVQHFVPQPQFKVVQDTTTIHNRPYNNNVVHEGLKNYYGKIRGGVPKDDSTSLALDRLRQIDGRLENLQIRPSTILAKNEQNKSVLDPRNAAESYQVSVPPPPPLHNVNLYPHRVVKSFVADAAAAENSVHPPIGEWQDTVPWSQSRIPGDEECVAFNENNTSYISPSNRVPDNSAPSLFSNQDTWNLRPEVHFPPPKHSKIPIRKEKAVLSNKGLAEELIKQELQASDSPPIAKQIGEVQRANVEIQQRDKLEDIKTKLTKKINHGIPASDSIGRLQIIKNSDLEELQELGVGTIGTVYHGKWRGTDVAIKRINDRCFAGKPSDQERMVSLLTHCYRDDFWNEAIKLADLHHPNVVTFYGVVFDGLDDSVATVTEYMVNGSLRNVLQKSERPLDKHKRVLISMDVAFGMEYLHGKNIVHFDLKSDNLLVNLRDPQRPICKVGDLGLSKVKCQTLISGGVRGTLPWMAPELLNGGSSSLVSDKVDVFSFGIVMWELLTGKEPYTDLHYGAIIGGIMSNTLRPPVPETCDPEWRVLMERCWTSEPSKRPNFTEVANELRVMAAKLPPNTTAISISELNKIPSSKADRYI
ncbi:hypothetical protein ACJIZ3_025305 [Penstemon smallii]|uniref:Protein kinase domain-containing protein n=1 Tax=Penstemon smallii TaxID=265156 RepID=A0ABD3TU66_9LAMI